VKNYCKPNDVLHLLHVQRTTDDVASQVEHKTEAAAQALLRMFLDRASLAKIKCKGRVVVGDEKHEICKEVLWVCADVLIVGSRGLNHMQRVFLGSVSEYCAQNCACPVIIVKPTAEGRKFNSNGSLTDDSTSENHIPGLDGTEDDL
jgi:nucleotide-binding universal stress UspA family protein